MRPFTFTLLCIHYVRYEIIQNLFPRKTVDFRDILLVIYLPEAKETTHPMYS